jgi:carboxypeptidase Taq
MGAMAAAQMAAAARTANPDIMRSVAAGDFGPVITWLRANVHAEGSLHSTDEILQEATGSGLSADAFKRHLRQRYLEDA